MAPTEETFSRIVRSLLLDVDIHMDQLEQIGYLSKDQRQFLDKFLYKSEDALRATAVLRNLSDEDLLTGRLPTYERSSATDTTSSSACSVNGLGNVTFPNVSTIPSAAGQLKAEKDALTTFLKRCSAHNFSVEVRGASTGKESSAKAKGPEYILTLEPIAEDTEKAAAVSKFDQKALGNSLPARVNHDTKMMLYGAENLTRDIDAESVDYETNLHIHDGADPDPVEVNHMVKQAVENDPRSFGTGHTEIVGFGVTPVEVGIAKPIDIDMPVKVDLQKVEPLNPACSLSQPSTDHTAEIKVADGDFAHKKEQTLPGNHSDDAVTPNKQIEEDAERDSEEAETNAWGKPMKPDPTKNKEGAVVAGSAKALGSNNKGRAMMEKMGWFKGAGLGKEKGGILEPITGVVKTSKAGLCSSEEKKRKPVVQPHAAASNGTRKSTSSGEDTAGSELTVAESWDGGNISQNTDWENYSERLQSDADWAAVKQHAEEIVRNRPSFKGIQAFHIRNADDTSLEKTIVFKAKIKGKNEYKTTRHYPGVVIKATSPQSSDFLNQENGFKVSCGHYLEILRPHQGGMYHAFNFNLKKRGIVKVALVEMKEQPVASKVSVSSSTSTPALATARA